MPDGATHDRLTLAFIPVFGLLAFTTTTPTMAFIAMVGMSLGSILLSPDLDHDAGSDPYRVWGPLRHIWHVYRVLIPHRSVLSHTYVIGTAIRLIYLSAFIAPAVTGAIYVAVWLEWIPPESPQIALTYVEIHRLEFAAFALGVEAASGVHITADKYFKN
jgi:uncharacterized metal-binding protein